MDRPCACPYAMPYKHPKRMNTHFHKLLAAAMLIAVITGLSTACQEETLLDEVPVMVQEEAKDQPFQWTRAEDKETRHAFLRNFGVGYSYDAVRGEYCNWEDIRCQVINRARLDYAMEVLGTSDLWSSGYAPTYHSIAKYEYSHRDYIAASTISTKEEIDLGLYSGTKRKKQYVLEDGVEENFYYTITEEVQLGIQSIDVASICATAKYYTDDVLTYSFIDAVKHLATVTNDNFAAVDSFINVWGTHVIVEASLGGKLQLDLQNSMWRYKDFVKEEDYTSNDIAFFYSKREENRKAITDYKFITDANLCVTAFGGDQSTLTGLLGEYKYDGTRTFSTEGVRKWTESLHFDRENDENSNVEMINMKVEPIWTFIKAIDEDVALVVKAHVINDAKAMQALLGERNFFSTQFPVEYSSCSFQYRKGTGDWREITRTDSSTEPMVVNIVSGGRYIATVCHEHINGHWMWVAYPIYEGKIKLACGLGVRDDNTYWEVSWRNGLLFTEEVTFFHGESPTGKTFYINGGQLALVPSESVDYAESFALPYYELSGGVRPDGSYESLAFPVLKDGPEFVCHKAPHNLAIPLISWEKANGPVGAAGISNNVDYWKRLSEFTYIYNPNETRK